MNKVNKQKGQVIIINTLLFFTLSVAIIFALTSPVISSFHITKSFSKSKEAFLLANSATSEALYKLNTGMDLSSSEIVTLEQGAALIGVADTMEGKTVSVTSDVDTYQRKQELKLAVGSGVSFNYGLQVGEGGIDIRGNSGIIGNIYSNGDIIGHNNAAYVTGTAVSASVSSPLAVVSNTGIIDPAYQLTFGGNSITVPQDLAQSFTVSTTTPISSVRILIKKTGSPWANITMRVTTDNSGKPSNNDIAEATITSSTVTSTFNYLTVPLDSSVSLTPGTTYWIVFDVINFWGQTYSLAANDSLFADGVAKLAQNGWSQNNGGTWIDTTPTTRDIYFDLYTGGETGLIDDINVGTGGVGDAWAYEVKESVVQGVLYCQSGSSNNKSCDTSRSDPVQQAFPISDGNIIDWKAEVESGEATSTKAYGWGTHSLGPIKVEGDLSINGGGTLNLGGTVHVTGDITVSNGAKIRVNPALGSTSAVLISDGVIKTSGGGGFEGSGASGSYVLVISTSDCPSGPGCSGDNAIEITGGAGAVVLNAQNGTIEFTGGAQARQATANRITMSEGTTVIYESGLVNPTFTSGPSGAWNIDSWKEVE